MELGGPHLAEVGAELAVNLEVDLEDFVLLADDDVSSSHHGRRGLAASQEEDVLEAQRVGRRARSAHRGRRIPAATRPRA